MADAVGWTYRKDWFSRPESQAEFKKKYGRDLAPQKTYDELKQVAEFFQGREIDGKKVYQIGLPIHQGFRGIQEDKERDARTPANLLTPAVTDPNAHTPESKGFLVKVEKA